MVRPSIQREITIDLPDILIESLGDGAEMLAHHLTKLAEVGTLDPEHNPPPLPVLCRICERQITPWWFPKHTELCLQEHQADAELQLAQERLTDHRNAIVNVLDALEAQTRHKSLTSIEAVASPPPRAEYKGQVIGMYASPASSSGRASPASSSSESSQRPSSGFSHHRARSFAVRRPLSRIVELILDLCDTALEINQPSIKDSRPQGEDVEIRTQSPQSEGRISQVLQWQSPSAATLESETGLSALCDDTSHLARAKAEAVLLCRRILEYSERIRSEYTTLVQDCIEAAMQKAARIAAGESSSSEESEEDVEQADPTGEEDQTVIVNENPTYAIDTPVSQPVSHSASRRSSVYDMDLRHRVFGSYYDGPSSMSTAMKQGASRSSSPQAGVRRVSSAMSTRSNSPGPQLLQPQPSVPQTTTFLESTPSIAESETAIEGSGTLPTPIRAPSRQTRSPSVEQTLSRAPSTRARKRTSLILPNRARSTTRTQSPGRDPSQPVSPLRIGKPRLPSASVDNNALKSPTFGGSEFCSPDIPARVPHHRRQSSAASSELGRAALSPRLSIAQPPPKAVPPSIKDFEIIKPISKGAFGSVYLAKKKSTGDYFAIKALKKQDMVAKNQVANVKAERAIMMFQGESDFVAKLYWTFPSKDYIFLVMEYLNGGDCAALVHSLGTLPEDWAKRYIAEVVQGVDYLHSREIVHRDLKPDNLLVDAKGHLKLTDFGLSRMGLIGRQKRALSNKSSGTALAPDPLKQGPFYRSTSMGTSRSASFDVQNNPSPGGTPTLMPAMSHAEYGQPSYFTLSREDSGPGSRDRQSSSQHSDAGDVDDMQKSFRRFSIYDHGWSESSRSSPKDAFGRPDDDGLSVPLSQVTSNTSQRITTPPPVSGAMLPPPMALFDPDDSNRRFVGTPDYLAPETINGLGQDEMSDWWSLGCILFEFLFGYPPFHAPTPEEVFDNILNRKIDWPEIDDCEVSADARDLINRLVCLDPGGRLGSNMREIYASGGEEIKKHPWFEDIDWDKLNEIEASFIPAPEHVEDTEYFEARGATLHDFAAQFEDQSTSPSTTPMADFERPHDALSKVRAQVNAAGSMKRGLLPLHIPPHVRDIRVRRQSEPAAADDFGQFAYKNLPVLNKSNQDVIQKLKAEAMQAQSRSSQGGSTHQNTPQSATAGYSPPSLESSPMIGMPVRRALSTSRGNHRSASPSTLSHTNSSPSRQSQPSSPLVHFSAGNPQERRKTSSGSSNHHHIPQQQTPSFFEIAKLATTNLSQQSSSSSPVKSTRPSIGGDSVASLPGPSSPRTRSHTIGSSESESLPPERIRHHQKRRSQAIDISPSSSDTEDPRQKALLRVHRRRQSSRRMSQIYLGDGPIFRPLDVLVVEDHPVSRLVMEKLMGKLRCRAIVARDGAEAVRFGMGSVKFDIIMTEYRLPQVNGADVARMLRETKNANSQTPVVAVTGYLKDLQAPHHFDALLEKPPTVEKLTEVLSRLCQWRPPPPGYTHASAMMPPLPSSNLRKESYPEGPLGESPTSSTGYTSLPSISADSSRDDSISSVSTWTDRGDLDQKFDDPTITTKRGVGDWTNMGGLGISNNSPQESRDMAFKHVIPTLSHEVSAPAVMQVKGPRKSPSTEQIEAKRRGFLGRERANSGDAGDDEDEDLSSTGRARSRSPPKSPPKNTATDSTKLYPKRSHHASKLSTEMLRTNSQGNVVSPGGSVKPWGSPEVPDTFFDAITTPSEHPLAQTTHVHSGVTPPEIFEMRPGREVKEFPMDIEHGGDDDNGDGDAGANTETRLLHPDIQFSYSESAISTDSDPTPKLPQSPAHED